MIVELQERIAREMKAGRDLEWVEDEIIDPCSLSTDQKAALWLFAWTRIPKRTQRRHAEILVQYVG